MKVIKMNVSSSSMMYIVYLSNKAYCRSVVLVFLYCECNCVQPTIIKNVIISYKFTYS